MRARSQPHLRFLALHDVKYSGGDGPLRSGEAVLVLRDVTEARAAENMRRALAPNASHELRTPVSIVRAHGDTLLAGAFDEPDVAPPFARTIEPRSILFSSLLADILDLARIEAGSYARSLEVLNPHNLLADLAVSYGPPPKSPPLAIINAKSSDLRVYTDRQTPERALLNLVDNAITYSCESGTVEVSATTSSRVIRFEVQDNRPRIERQLRRCIFERI